MRVRLAPMLLGYVVIEAVLLAWWWSAFGSVALVSLLLAGFLIGLLVMRLAGIKAFRALADVQQRAAAFGVTASDGSEQVVMGAAPTAAEIRSTTQDLGSSSLLFVAGILFASPGIISDVAGLALLLPPVRRSMTRRIGSRMSGSMRSSTTITVVQMDETRGSNSDSPHVIRGEMILPPGSQDDH